MGSRDRERIGHRGRPSAGESTARLRLPKLPASDYIAAHRQHACRAKPKEGIRATPMDEPIALVEPGRNGDVMNILPLAKYLHDRGEQVDFLIHPKFASLLEGVSYVRPVLLPFDDEHRSEEARVWAAARYPRVIVSKV